MTVVLTSLSLLVAMAVEGAHKEITELPIVFDHGILYEGDRCTLPSNETAVCLKLKDCARTVQDIQTNKMPTICSFDKEESIVCCPATLNITQSLKLGSLHVKNPGDRAKEACEVYHQNTKNFSMDRTCSTPLHPQAIMNGRVADYVETPHMAAIGFGEEDDVAWLCGGSLISPRFVLTAGHCLQSQRRGLARWVRLGDLNLADPSDDAYAQQFSVSERIPHPDYRPPSHYNDVALLRLDREIAWSDYVHPACLYMSGVNAYSMSALGWGLTDWRSSKGSDVLMTAYLVKMPDEQCHKTVQYIAGTRRLRNGFDNETMFCASDPLSGQDTCKGDSGGPLQVSNLIEGHCIFYIIGITSFGPQICGVYELPAMYSRVLHFVPWIEDVVWP